MTLEIYINGALSQTENFVAAAQGQSRTITVSRGGETVGEVVVTCDEYYDASDYPDFWQSGSWMAFYGISATPSGQAWQLDYDYIDWPWSACDYNIRYVNYETWDEQYETFRVGFKDGVYTSPFLVHDPASGLLVSTGAGGSLVNAY